MGDITKFRTIDLWNNSELSSSDAEVVEVNANNFVFRFKNTINPEPRTTRSDKSWNRCSSMRGSSDLICDGSLKFPMQVGNKHTYKDMPWANGRGRDAVTCEVVGEEKVSAAAGTFDTLRINCAGFYTRAIDGNFTGKFNTVTWYAPSIQRVVKFQYFDFNASGAFNKNQTDLTEFIPSK